MHGGLSTNSNAEQFVNEMVMTIISESSRTAFRSEGQISGFIVGRFVREDKGVIINSEVTTPIKYRAENGLLRENPEGRYGDIDLQIILNDTDKIYLELEYPRGTGREQVNFKNHIQRDLIKLNAVKDSVLTSVLIFDYKNYDDFDHHDEIKKIAANQGKTWIVHVRLPYKGEDIGKWEKRVTVRKPEE